jgi:hypothetical protein
MPHIPIFGGDTDQQSACDRFCRLSILAAKGSSFRAVSVH